MRTLISNLLLNLSKISPTKSIATPTMEFLSTLIRLPELYNSFIDTNYMSVFAITLPYTNPLKFDPYTVALAHHVIVMWFLKCRLAYRQNFVQFIINGLNNNVLNNFEEGKIHESSLVKADILIEFCSYPRSVPQASLDNGGWELQRPPDSSPASCIPSR